MKRTLLALTLCLSFALPVSGQEVAAGTIEANKALVRRYIAEVLTAGRFELLEELVAADFVDRTPGVPSDARGPRAIRESQTQARELFDDIRYTIEDLIAEGDRVVARYTVRARRKVGEGAAGQPIEVTGVTIFQVAGGKIREAWIVNDQIELFRQLGYTFVPPKPEAP
jgi:predicted ester cyclase